MLEFQVFSLCFIPRSSQKVKKFSFFVKKVLRPSNEGGSLLLVRERWRSREEGGARSRLAGSRKK